MLHVIYVSHWNSALFQRITFHCSRGFIFMYKLVAGSSLRHYPNYTVFQRACFQSLDLGSLICSHSCF